MTMKRLFVLRHNKGGAIVKGADGQPLYFDSKAEAKRARDLFNGYGGKETVVSKGPDNRNL